MLIAGEELWLLWGYVMRGWRHLSVDYKWSITGLAVLQKHVSCRCKKQNKGLKGISKVCQDSTHL